MKFSEKDMLDLVNDVEREFADFIAKSETQESEELVKAEENTEGYSDSEIQELDGIYSSMNKAEAEIHYQSLKKALFGKAEESEEEEKEEKEEDKKEDSKEDEKEMEKSEKDSEISLIKSEKEQLAKENEELKKSMEEIKASLAAFVASKQAPQRKAITDVEVLKKTETENKPLTKSEIDAKLKSVIRNPSLAKKDREAINSYYFNGSIESIKHLL
jgi:hypothetical protein